MNSVSINSIAALRGLLTLLLTFLPTIPVRAGDEPLPPVSDAIALTNEFAATGYGFAFHYPEDWVVKTIDGQVNVYGPEGTAAFYLDFSIQNVLSMEAGGRFGSEVGVLADFRKNFRNEHPDARFFDKKKGHVTAAGEQVAAATQKAEYEREDGIRLRYWVLVFARPDGTTFHALVYSAPVRFRGANIYDDYLHHVEGIIDSLVLTTATDDPPPPPPTTPTSTTTTTKTAPPPGVVDGPPAKTDPTSTGPVVAVDDSEIATRGDEILGVMVTPAAGPHTFGAGGAVAVTVPAGAVERPVRLSVRKVSVRPERLATDTVTLCALDVSLEDLHEFGDELVIDIRHAPEPDGEQLRAAYWDEVRAVWTPLRLERLAPDSSRVFTNHLSILHIQKALLGEYWLSRGRHAVVWCHRKVPAKAFLASQQEYAQTVRDAFDAAWESYAGKNYPMPTGIILFMEPGGDSQYDPYSNHLLLAAHHGSKEEIGHDVAHELFHAVQNRSVNMVRMSFNRWWIETAADYAAGRVAYGRQGTGYMGTGIGRNYIRKPLWYFSENADDPWNGHQYHNAFLVDYLLTRFGEPGDFQTLWELTASQIGLANGPAKSIREYAGRLGTSLPECYRRFVAHLLLSSQSPAVASKDDATIGSSLDLLDARNRTVYQPFQTVETDCTAALWAVKAAAELSPEGEPVPLEVGLFSKNVPAGVFIDVYRLARGELSADFTPQPVGSFTSDAATWDRSILVPARSDDVLYVVTTNADGPRAHRSSAMVSVLAADVTLRVYPNEKNPMAFRFQAEITNLPPGAKAAHDWRFQDGWTGRQGPVIEHEYRTPGSYEVAYSLYDERFEPRALLGSAKVWVTAEEPPGNEGGTSLPPPVTMDPPDPPEPPVTEPPGGARPPKVDPNDRGDARRQILEWRDAEIARLKAEGNAILDKIRAELKKVEGQQVRHPCDHCGSGGPHYWDGYGWSCGCGATPVTPTTYPTAWGTYQGVKDRYLVMIANVEAAAQRALDDL